MFSFFKRPLSLTSLVQVSILLLIILILIPVILFVVYPWYKELITPVPEPVNDTYTKATIDRILYNVPAEPGTEPVFGYYDLNSASTETHPTEYLYMPTVSEDGLSLLASGIVIDNKEQTHAALYLKHGIFDGEVEERFIYSSSTIDLFRQPRISPDGEIYIFEVAPAAEVGTEEWYRPDNWTIYTGEVDSGRVPTPILIGANAKFLPDGNSLIYLDSAGLRTYNITTGEDTVIVPAGDESLSIHTQIALSDDGKFFAISKPLNSSLLVYEVSSLSPFVLGEQLYDFEVQAFWPTFSPDSTAIAVEQVEWGDVSVPAHSPRLTLLDLTTGKMHELANWRHLDPTTITISDWVTVK